MQLYNEYDPHPPFAAGTASRGPPGDQGRCLSRAGLGVRPGSRGCARARANVGIWAKACWGSHSFPASSRVRHARIRSVRYRLPPLHIAPHGLARRRDEGVVIRVTPGPCTYDGRQRSSRQSAPPGTRHFPVTGVSQSKSKGSLSRPAPPPFRGLACAPRLSYAAAWK